MRPRHFVACGFFSVVSLATPLFGRNEVPWVSIYGFQSPDTNIKIWWGLVLFAFGLSARFAGRKARIKTQP
jgi:hypothetical protein